MWDSLGDNSDPTGVEAMEITTAPLQIDHYDEVITLWKECEGVGLSEADSRGSINAYLQRNPGMSFVATDSEARIVGAILAGHDGRRGYLHHLAVNPAFRRQGIGSKLVEKALSALRQEGIRKVHLFIFETNASGLAFWEASGWTRRIDIGILSKNV